MQFSLPLSILSKWVAFISFIVGSIIFGLYYQTGRPEFLDIAHTFLIISAVVNISMLCLLLAVAKKKETSNSKNLYFSAAIIIGNISIMAIYIISAITVMSYMRITFNNSTGELLQNIEIVGCESKTIKKLENGHMTSVWIKLPTECSIDIHYKIGNTLVNEIVYPHTDTFGGQVLYHRIGKTNNHLANYR